MTIIEKYLVKRFHESKINSRDMDQPEFLGWSSKEVQQIRFEAIVSMTNFNATSILDVGCGYGDLKAYLDCYCSNFEYIGLDQEHSFIDFAKKRFQNQPSTWFYATDFTCCNLPLVDIIIASGALSYRCENPNFYIEQIQRFYEAANKIFIFNMLDDSVFESGSVVVSHNKEYIYNQCKLLCKDVSIKANYLDNDFTIMMKKKNQSTTAII